MRILYVAYPLVPVSAQSCGGAEQMLHAVEVGMARRGHKTTVVACQGSVAAGRVIATEDVNPAADSLNRYESALNARVLDVLREARDAGIPFDLVHDHGGSFWRCADEVPEPVLLSAHHRREYYGNKIEKTPPNVFVNCVSDTQGRAFAQLPAYVGVVHNGIALHRFPFSSEKRDYLLWLGRICEEKGAHIAIDVARFLGSRIVVAGDVYAFSYHREYFQREVLSRVGDDVELIIRPNAEAKSELLAHARAVLIPSTVEETSSLVAMEAAASGTPVIAFNVGALPEVVARGKTGFVVSSGDAMAAAVERTDEILPEVCRRHAVSHFNGDRMVTQYEAFYWRVRKLHEQSRLVAA